MDLSFTAPYSPATLSNIRGFDVRVNTFMKPRAPIQLGIIRHIISVSYIASLSCTFYKSSLYCRAV